MERDAALAVATELLTEYAHAVDSGSGADVAALFTSDGRLEGVPDVGALHGREAIADYFEAHRRRRTGQRRHHINNVRVAPAGDAVHVSSYFMSVGRAGMITGAYDDEVVFAEAGPDAPARFRVKRVTVEWDQVNEG